MARIALLLTLCPAVCALKAMEPEDKCACMPWKTAFAAGADCDWSTGRVEPCNKLLMKLPDEVFCVPTSEEKVQKDRLSNHTWCYVSRECPSGFPNGQALNSSVGPNIRVCDDTERSISDFSPMELLDWTRKNDMDISLVIRGAYPSLADTPIKDTVRFWGLKLAAGFPKTEKWTKLKVPQRIAVVLGNLTASGQRWFIKPGHQQVPFLIVDGPKMYWLNFAEDLSKRLESGEQVPASRLYDVKCVLGCDEVSELWWSPLDDANHPEDGVDADAVLDEDTPE